MARSVVLALAATLVLAASANSMQPAELESPVVHDLLPVSDAGRPRSLADSMRVLVGGCHDLSTPEGIGAAIESGFGPLKHYDGMLPVDLGDGRSLWFVQDGFLDWESDGIASTLFEMQYTNNLAVVFDEAGCAEVLVDGPNVNGRYSFELSPSPERVAARRLFYWPLAALVENGRLVVTWAEMIVSAEEPTIFDGITRHPGPTFVAEYDIESLARISWTRFDDHGLGFGFWATPGADGWVYHFGNRNLLNLARNGGYGNGPHPATLNYLGRGRSLAGGVQEVWNGSEWVTDVTQAAPIHQEGWVASMLRPVRDDEGQWVTTVKQDEFWGTDVDVLVADEPTGPWHRAGTYEVPDSGDAAIVTYHPTILDADGCDISLLLSANAAVWDEALAEPDLYLVRPLTIDRC